jgi:hypothetical protein
MADVSKINGYNVKDVTARDNSATANEEITKIKNGTTIVPNANIAAHAATATNYDTTIGNIKSKFDELEEKIDSGGTPSNMMTTDTVQDITGQKKFGDYKLVMNDHADFLANDIDINSNPTSEKFAYFNGKDKNGNMLGAIGFYQDPAGNTGAYLQANRGATWGGNLGIKTKAGTSDVFAYAPNPPDNSNTNQIATSYWVNNKRPKINGNANYNSASNFYVPITAGESGNVLVSTGSGSPSWVTNFLGRNTSVYYASVTTGSKSFYQSIAKFTYIFFWLSGGTENYPFLIPRTEFIRKNSNNNKLSIASNDYNQNRYVNLYYVNEYGFYITSFSNIDMIEIVGMR